MSTMLQTARSFFDACETGKGWDACKPYCHAEASFSAQCGVLKGVDSLAAYTAWMKGLLGPIPDGHYELKFFAADEARKRVAAFAVFHGTNTAPGAAEPPTGKTVAADYVYVMDFDGDRICHMTKIWNDTISIQQLGWG